MEWLEYLEQGGVSKSLNFPFLISKMMLILIRMMPTQIKREKVNVVCDGLLKIKFLNVTALLPLPLQPPTLSPSMKSFYHDLRL